MKVRKTVNFHIEMEETDQIIGLIVYDHAEEKIKLRATTTTGIETLAALFTKVIPGLKFTSGEGNEI